MEKSLKDGRAFVEGTLPLSRTLAFVGFFQPCHFLAVVNPTILRLKAVLLIHPRLDLLTRSDAAGHPLWGRLTKRNLKYAKAM